MLLDSLPLFQIHQLGQTSLLTLSGYLDDIVGEILAVVHQVHKALLVY